MHALATAAGCQLVASCDLAVAAESAGFAAPGGKGGWFCHTPMVAIARNVGRKRAMELALTGDVIDAATALDWGLVNRVVPDAELDEAVDDLMARATRGSRASKAWGKQTMYAQLDRPERDAYTTAIEVMAAASQIPGAREGMAAFLEKRAPGLARLMAGPGQADRPVMPGYGVLPADQGSGLLPWAEAERRLTVVARLLVRDGPARRPAARDAGLGRLARRAALVLQRHALPQGAEPRRASRAAR